MLKTHNRTFYVLSILIIILMIGTSIGGIFLNGLYRDNPFVSLVWRTTDWITLIVAVPILIVSVILTSCCSQQAQLVWLAMLDYCLYNYAYYLFAAAFNWFFLLYVALFTLSIAALILGLVNLNIKEISRQFQANTPTKWISAYMLFVAGGLTTIYLIMIIGFILTGQLPPIIEKTGHPTNIVFALDLSFVVPLMVLGAIWLWKRQPWGYVLAAISVVKGTIYTFVLAMVSIAAVNAGFSDSAGEIPLWILLSAAGGVASVFLLGNIKAQKLERMTT